jgi:hypothetical protein
VPQQILSILEADSGGTEAMTERVSQIMHPYLYAAHYIQQYFHESFLQITPQLGI